MKRGMLGLRTVAMAGACAAVLLAGCSSGDSQPSPSPSGSIEELPRGQIDDVPELAEGWQGIKKDVTIDNCPLQAGDVTADGTVINTASEPRDINIVISWNREGTADPIIRLSTTKEDVPAGETVGWSLSGNLPADAGTCVISAKSGQVVG